jgi:hypothetical protein
MLEQAAPDSICLRLVATSYPRSESDWQGLFIKRMLNSMTANPRLKTQLWAPAGPIPDGANYAPGAADASFLNDLANKGGIAHLLRNKPIESAFVAAKLLRCLRRAYRTGLPDLFHINWLQNSIPLIGLKRKALITVLGTDYELLHIPGMTTLIRSVLKTNECILAPNASWMEPRLKELFGDLAQISTVNFGIGEQWYGIHRNPQNSKHVWLCVTRITTKKIGFLFDWGRQVFSRENPLHLIGPRQESLQLPEWVVHHGPATGDEIAATWFPATTALISLSEHSEGRPQIMLEAMAAGIPIVASDIPAHRSTIVQNETGFIVKDSSSFSDALQALSDGSTQDRMSSRAKSLAKRDFGTWDDCIKRYIKLYESLF